MATSTSIWLDQTRYDPARADALLEQRAIAGQVEYGARVSHAAGQARSSRRFHRRITASMAEAPDAATNFIARSKRV